MQQTGTDRRQDKDRKGDPLGIVVKIKTGTYWLRDIHKIESFVEEEIHDSLEQTTQSYSKDQTQR